MHPTPHFLSRCLWFLACILGLVAGSPAHAGIDPGWTGSRKTSGGFPRTRGDRPELK